MVMRHILLLLAIGIAAGIPIAWACARFVASMLFGVKATDLTTLAVATAVLVAVGLAAGFPPAFRASRVGPTVARRYE
jgi:ABC-type antimicrobial peptide transport system permease subunit